MQQMKEYFLRFVVHAIWRRRKYAYYAVSAISIAGNLLVLVGPTLLPYIQLVLHTIGFSQTGSLQTAFHAASAFAALQTRAWNALPHFAELVMQRSVLYILLNLILATIVVKSGLLAGRTSSQPACMKQGELSAVSNLRIARGSHWLAPSYLHTVYSSTMSNFLDVSAASSMLLQHAHHVHGRGSAATTDASKPKIQVQGHVRVHYLHKNLPSQSARPLLATPAAPTPPAPSRPSLFTIEPLEESVQSMQPLQAPILEAQINRHPLLKVATKVDLVHAVKARRRTESTTDQPMHQQQKSGRRDMQGVKDKHDIRKMKEHNRGQPKEHNRGQPMKQSKAENSRGGSSEGRGGSSVKGRRSEGDGGGGGDVDNQLSRQEFNERVDTFICKVKRSLTMQRKDSVLDFIRLHSQNLGLVS